MKNSCLLKSVYLISIVLVMGCSPSMNTTDVPAILTTSIAGLANPNEKSISTKPPTETSLPQATEIIETVAPTLIANSDIIDLSQVGSQWELIGPPNIQDTNSHGSLVVSKVDSQYRYAYFGEQGLLISTNGGMSWKNGLNALWFLGLNDTTVTHVIPHPLEPATAYIIADGKLIVSMDGGLRWKIIPSDQYVYDVGVASDGKTLYLLQNNQIKVSHDAGVNWVSTSPEFGLINGFSMIVVDSIDSNVAYAIINNLLIIYQPAENKWITPGILGSVLIQKVIIDQTLPGEAYALTSENALYRTTNSGASWGLVADLSPYSGRYGTDVSLFFARDSKVLMQGTPPIEGFIFEQPCNSLYQSDDRGVTWFVVSQFPSCPISANLTLIKDTNTLYTYTNEHFIKSLDEGKTWNDVEPLPRPFRLSASSDGKIIFSHGKMVSRSEDAGLTWNYINPVFPNNDINYSFGVVQNSQEPSQAYLTFYLSVLKTEDGGKNWIPIVNNIFENTNTAESAILNLQVDPNNFQNIYLARPKLMSMDGGKSWKSYPLIDGQATIGPIIFQPGSSGHLLIGLFINGFMSNRDGGLYASQDGGNTLQIRGLSSDFSIISLAYDPNNPNKVYAVAKTVDGMGVFISADDAFTWEKVSDISNLEAQLKPYSRGGVELNYQFDLIVDPRNSNLLYLALGSVYISSDGGKTWGNLWMGMGNQEEITQMTTSVNPFTLYAAGRSGIWKIVP